MAAMGLNSLPLGYTLVVLPIYLSNIGFSGEVIGAITAASSLASTIALIPFAIAADRYGRKPFVFWGFLSATLAYLFFAFTRDLNSLLLAGAIGGIGLAGGFSTAVWTPAWTALISEKASPEKRTNAFAWSQGIWTIALTIGSAASILPTFFRVQLNSAFAASYEYPFLIFAVLAVMSGLVLIPVSEGKTIPRKAKNRSHRSFFPRKSRPQIAKFSDLGVSRFRLGHQRPVAFSLVQKSLRNDRGCFGALVRCGRNNFPGRYTHNPPINERLGQFEERFANTGTVGRNVGVNDSRAKLPGGCSCLNCP